AAATAVVVDDRADARGVAANGAVEDTQGGARGHAALVVDAATEALQEGDRVAADGAIADRQRAMVVEHAAAREPSGVAISDGQPRNADDLAGTDIKHASGMVAVDRQLIGAWTDDGDTAVNIELKKAQW